ncbi:MAG: hypothetical protein RM338_12440 [Nostoc sp. DedQUE12a]|nr:hypothetical protein [Nostoc sp. DedQUE12a]
MGTSIDALIISPDSKTFITGGLGREIRLRDIKTTKSVMELTGHAGGIYGLAISSDGQILYSGSGDKSIKVWLLEPIAARDVLGLPARSKANSRNDAIAGTTMRSVLSRYLHSAQFGRLKLS